jgi:hypothetical protein
MYRVMWSIDIEADTPESAAEQALTMQRDPESTATVFAIIDEFNRETTVDLGHRHVED